MILFFLFGIFSCIALTLSFNTLDIRVVYRLIGSALGGEFLVSLALALNFLSTGAIEYYDLGTLTLNNAYFDVSLSLLIDELSSTFSCILFLALGICFLFLLSYFSYDFNNTTIVLLSSIFSQLAFIFFATNDLFTLIFFWEGISFTSFLLIQYWVGRVATIKAALKVFTISQLGDLFFFIFIFTAISQCESTNFEAVLIFCDLNEFRYLGHLSLVDILALTLASAMLLKSAQFIFFPWLLDAMEAPVPISAQLHSSTLVIIGFYVVYRFYPLVQASYITRALVFYFAAITVVSASVLGYVQRDGKRLLACSTASQLGYVAIALSLDLANESLLLLIFCCCNKALTFIWFGLIMDKNGGISDLRTIKRSKVSQLERLGLFFSTLSSTIGPYSLGWHVKALCSRGVLALDQTSAALALGLLSVTWFFSTIYLFALCFSLMCLPETSSFMRGTPSYFNGSRALSTYEANALMFVLVVAVQATLTSTSIYWTFFYAS